MTKESTTGKHFSDLRVERVPEVLHELKIPISSIKGYTSILLTNEVGPTNPRQNEILTRIIDRCDYLTETITRLFQLSKPSPHILSKEKIALNDVIIKNIKAIHVFAAKRNIKIHTHLPKSNFLLWAIESDLDQILSNLLSNAVKYNKRSGRITLSLKIVGKYAILSVSDTGIGIPQKDQVKIFKKYYKQDTSDKKAPTSTGLGLGILKEIVENYDGKVDCKSKPGRGSTFTVRIPVPADEDIYKDYFNTKKKLSLKNNIPFTMILISCLNQSGLRNAYSAGLMERFLNDTYSTVRSAMGKQDKLFMFKNKNFIAVLADTDRESATLMKQCLLNSEP